jgi:hypothetical protein
MEMKKYWVVLACCASLQALAQPSEFSFGVIAREFNAAAGDPVREAIVASDQDNLGFVVVNGIKPKSEACSDAIYGQRKAVFEEAKNGLVVSPAASDWSDCRNLRDRSAAVDRLNRLRELFFVDEFSFGASKIPMVRQSATAKFRNYSENARWEIDDIMFATVNLPANNNHYRIEAGRNSEFEDRLIANRDWLQRIFSIAARRKMAGIVLFSDGNPLAAPGFSSRLNSAGKRDGYAEMRQQIAALSARFSGRVLLVHGQAEATKATIDWRGNLGELGVGTGWAKIDVKRSLSVLFAVGNSLAENRNVNR